MQKSCLFLHAATSNDLFTSHTELLSPGLPVALASHQAPLLCYLRRPELLLGTPSTYHRWINKSRKTLSWCRAKPPDETLQLSVIWEYSRGWAQAECDWWVQPPECSHEYIQYHFRIRCSCCNSKVNQYQRLARGSDLFWELPAQREMQKWLPASLI